ncbi:MAG: hypothetical protein AB8B49_07415 [Nitratireductor sp.]
MADFHALILQALKTKNSDDPAVRQAVYQSSRNALVRMLDKSGNRDSESGNKLSKSLEDSIAKIETDYASFLASKASDAAQPTQPQAPKIEPQIAQQNVASRQEPSISVDTTPTTPVAPTPQAPAPAAPVQPVAPAEQMEQVAQTAQAAASQSGSQAVEEVNRFINPQVETAPKQSFEPFVAPPEVAAPNATEAQTASAQATNAQAPNTPPVSPSVQTSATEHVVVEPQEQPPLNYKRKSPWLRGFSSLLFILAILGVLAWLAYAFITSLSQNASSVAQSQKQKEVEQKATDSNYIEILSPSDPSSLITSGRGSAEVISQLTTNYMRIQSIRSSPNSNTNAEPILLELKPGVLRQMVGKMVTVEMRLKSGTNMDGLFSVQCIVGDQSVCDRKRFRVGQQPENVIFAMQLEEANVSEKVYLAINTDVKSASNPDGLGHPIDISHIRIRIPK